MTDIIEVSPAVPIAMACRVEIVSGSGTSQSAFTLARVECDFRTEALVKEVLEVGIRCSRIGTKSFAFEYAIREKTTGRVVVEAKTVQVCYDYATKSSLPVPDEMRRRLEAFEGRNLSSKTPA